MLRAHLENKLWRVISRAISPVEQHTDALRARWEAALRRDEDTLTAAVFERLSYLPEALCWRILSSACLPIEGMSMPTPPTSEAEWRFWPSYELAEGRVEPDVVVRGSCWLVIESKHRDDQRAVQWLQQLRAVRQSDGSLPVVHIAVGGCTRGEHGQVAREVMGQLDAQERANTHLLYLSWSRLADELAQAARSATCEPATRRILQAAIDVLAERGYRRSRLWLGTLPAFGLNAAASTTLARWRTAPSRRRLGFQGLRPLGLSHAPTPQARWSLRPTSPLEPST